MTSRQPLRGYGKGSILDRKDVNLLRVADKYVADLRATPKPDLWKDYYKLESKILAQKVGKRS